MAQSFPGVAGFSRYALFAGVAALALPAVAHAQDMDSVEEGLATELENQNTIVVTATKREQTLQETPVAVSVTTGETIEQAQIRDINDLQSVVPSLRVSTLQSAFSTTFSVRGFGTDGNNLGLEPSVAVFVDGVYRSRAISQISDLPNIQRVEVLRGPQSTLFGKNASAGVISIVSTPPSFDLEGSVEATYGNYNAMVGKAYISGPISDTIAASIAGGVNKRDGYITNAFNGDDVNDRNRWFTRGQLLYDNGSNLTVRLIGDYDEIDEKCCGVVQVAPSRETDLIQSPLIGGRFNDPTMPLADIIYSDVVPNNKVQNWGGSGQIDYDFGGMALTSITAYRDTSLSADQDVDFSSAQLASGAQIGEADINTFTQELRLASDFDGMFNFLVGGYYFKEDLEVSDQIVYGPDFRAYADAQIQAGSGGQLSVALLEGLTGGTFFTAGQGFFNNFTQDNEAFSLFGQVDLDLTDRLTLTLGANYTEDRKTVVSNSLSTDQFSQVDLAGLGQTVITQQAIATQVGGILGLPGPATAAQVQAFATGASPAGAAGAAAFPAIQAGAAAFGAANANLTVAQAAADGNPATVGNPFLNLRPLQFLPPLLNIPNAVEDGKTNDDNWSYIARLAYEFSDSINGYLSYATGFKASSFNLSRDSRPLPGDFAQIVGTPLATPNLRPGTRFALPEESTVYEAGLKTDWGLVGANLTVFLQQIKNFQANTFIGSSFVLANAGEQETFGIEFDGFARPTDELTLTLAMTYLNPKYTSFVGSPVGDLTGEPVAGVAPLSFSFGAQWNKELAGGNRLILRGDYAYESQVPVIAGLTNYVTPNLDGTSNYDLARTEARKYKREVSNLNASITYALDMGLEFSIWGRNILDDRYITTIFPSVAQGRAVSGYPNQPRTYGGTVRYKF
ncbi:MAG: TonB-dependent receptor [Erythrobacter sp.]|nr:TonB-dependent receptor [Erythrobacter sp.]NCQ64870.1 TonB-dependent receptor [Alphaproteobacteria bacterium]